MGKLVLPRYHNRVISLKTANVDPEILKQYHCVEHESAEEIEFLRLEDDDGSFMLMLSSPIIILKL